MNPLKKLTAHFQQVTSKQWKQRLQYELGGREYARTLQYTSHEEVTILPFYDSNVGKSSLKPTAIESIIGATLYCTDVDVTLTNIARWEEKGVHFFYLTLHSPQVDWRKLLNNMPLTAFGFIRLARPSAMWIEELSTYISENQSNWKISYDCIAHLMKTGTWYENELTDFKLIKKSKFPLFSVDTTHLQEAGAGAVQQLAYGISQAVRYLECVEREAEEVTVIFDVACGNHFLLEIAKLRAFRQLAEWVFSCYDFPIKIQFVGRLSVRHLSLLSGSYNQNYAELAYQMLSFGGCDILMTSNINVHEKNRWENEILTLKTIESALKNDKNLWNGSHTIQALQDELGKKSLKLFQETETLGGIVKLLIDNVLQKKIKEKAFQEQTEFNSKWRTIRFSAEDFVTKDEWERYPFVKLNRVKTSVEPLIIKRLWEKIERKIQD